MKTNISKAAAVLFVGAMAGLPAASLAQDSNASYAQAPVAVTATAPPQLSYGVSQIVQMAQARVNDDTIVSYIKNSGNSYGLNADQIIYLQQQGVSSAVITAMLSQPRAGVLEANGASSAPTSGQSAATYQQAPPAPSVVVTPPVTAATPPPAYYYYSPYYYSGYYPYGYPAYGYGYGFYPGVSVSLGWGRGWGGWHGGGGFHGGLHGGGGWHH